MTYDLKPRSHVGPVIATAIAALSAAWGASSWLNNRADKPAVEKLANESFQHRLDLETIKGDMKAFNIRLERLERGVDILIQKSEANDNRRRR